MALTLEDLEANRLDIPTVLLGERIADGGLMHVAIDNVAAAREATEHLVAGGRRRIAAVGGAPNVGPATRRVQGYLEALAAAGLPDDPDLRVDTGPWGRAAGFRAVDAVLRRGVELDALFCFNDVVAQGAIRALADHGLRVPRDVAVVGWDDTEEASYTTPSLTSVAPDKRAIARTTVERLLAAVDGEPAGETEVTCGYRLVVRESSAASAAG
jgi:DNA-binding LacI/PurR family transcriptional regulator